MVIIIIIIMQRLRTRSPSTVGDLSLSTGFWYQQNLSKERAKENKWKKEKKTKKERK